MGRCAAWLAVALLAGCGGGSGSDAPGSGEYPADANACVRRAWVEAACWASKDCNKYSDAALCWTMQEHPKPALTPCDEDSPTWVISTALAARAERCRAQGDPQWFCGHCTGADGGV